MKILLTIDYTKTDDPIRNRHGLAKLLSYAEELDSVTAAHGVELLTPVIWECEAPKGYCVLEAPSMEAVEPLARRFGHHPVISLAHVRFLDEVKVLAREKLDVAN